MNDFINSILNMTLEQIIQTIILISGIISIMIEKSKKLPFNPWSKMFEWIGSKFNKPLYEKIDKIEKDNNCTKELIVEMRSEYRTSIQSIKEDYNSRIDKMEKDSDEKEAKRLRANIICFSDSCRLDKNTYTKQHFENIFRDYDDYILYCEKQKIPNHFIDSEYNHIRRVFEERLKDPNFR